MLVMWWWSTLRAWWAASRAPAAPTSSTPAPPPLVALLAGIGLPLAGQAARNDHDRSYTSKMPKRSDRQLDERLASPLGTSTTGRCRR